MSVYQSSLSSSSCNKLTVFILIKNVIWGTFVPTAPGSGVSCRTSTLVQLSQCVHRALTDFTEMYFIKGLGFCHQSAGDLNSQGFQTVAISSVHSRLVLHKIPNKYFMIYRQCLNQTQLRHLSCPGICSSISLIMFFFLNR